VAHTGGPGSIPRMYSDISTTSHAPGGKAYPAGTDLMLHVAAARQHVTAHPHSTMPLMPVT
jgi:hypothetical protein